MLVQFNSMKFNVGRLEVCALPDTPSKHRTYLCHRYDYLYTLETYTLTLLRNFS